TSHTNRERGFQTISQTSSGIATTAVASLVRSTEAFAFGLRAGASEPALAALELAERLEKLQLAEIRPQRLRDVDLRVRELPEEEIADPHLPARPDEEIGIGDTGGAERGGDEVLIDLLGVEVAATHAPRDRPHGVGQLLAPAVAHREDHRHPGVVLRLLDDVAERRLDLARELPDVADR